MSSLRFASCVWRGSCSRIRWPTLLLHPGRGRAELGPKHDHRIVYPSLRTRRPAELADEEAVVGLADSSVPVHVGERAVRSGDCPLDAKSDLRSGLLREPSRLPRCYERCPAARGLADPELEAGGRSGSASVSVVETTDLPPPKRLLRIRFLAPPARLEAATHGLGSCSRGPETPPGGPRGHPAWQSLAKRVLAGPRRSYKRSHGPICGRPTPRAVRNPGTVTLARDLKSPEA